MRPLGGLRLGCFPGATRTMRTVIPGEYRGRTEHIQVRVAAPGKPVLTTQLYFADRAATSVRLCPFTRDICDASDKHSTRGMGGSARERRLSVGAMR
jgi:protocatechuate 3,4-dioxygenase beta subunit